MSIPFVGKCFPTVEGFLAYLDAIKFGAFRPQFVTMHHTGAPDLKTWRGWQTRARPITDEQWMKNLAVYYGSLGWSHGPHFFFTPAHYCVLSPPTERGTHAVSFNANSWGVECVGDFDVEPFDGSVRDRYIDGLAALHVAVSLAPTPFSLRRSGLHFHRDDPLTSKTCPGKNVKKDQVVDELLVRMRHLAGEGDHPAEQVDQRPATLKGSVDVPAGDQLNVRAAASAKAPILMQLLPGMPVTIIGTAMNGDTKWFRIDVPGDVDGFVAARFVKVA